MKNKNYLKTLDITSENIMKMFDYLDQSDITIGDQYLTPKGGVLTVVGWDGKKKANGRKKYECHCSLCSVDEELWGKGSISVTRSNIRAGAIPCGCSKFPAWTEKQVVINLERQCAGFGYVYRGFDEPFKGTDTKVRIYNPVSNYEWTTGSLESLKTGRGDPSLRVDKILASRRSTKNKYIETFLETGAFNENFSFEIEGDITHKSLWDVTCSVCSKDEYVVEGLCSGVFKPKTMSLLKGVLPCRCGKKGRWTEEQQVYKISKVFKENNKTFLGWDGGYNKTASKVSWLCENGHVNSSNLGNVLKNTKCRTCFNIENATVSGCYGYYPKRINEPDYLYLLRFNYKDCTSHLKCGRSFNVKRRCKDLINASGCESVDVLVTHTSNHEEVYTVEQKIKQVMYSEGLNYYEKGSCGLWEGATECYTDSPECYELINHLVSKSVLVQD